MSNIAKLTAAKKRDLILDRGNPLATAREVLRHLFDHEEGRTLQTHREQSFAWDASCYRPLSRAVMRSKIYKFCEPAQAVGKTGALEPFKPTIGRVNNILDALEAATHLPDDIEPPVWLVGESHPPAHELVICANGILHLPTLDLVQATPTLFATAALDVAFDPDSEDPKRWLEFLDQLWPGDPESVGCLQELFGYLLTSDTSLQKIFLIVGPKRSGKGTVARVLTALLNRDNVTGPTLAGLTSNFGLSPLIGKSAAIIADARLSGRADETIVAERLLSISGEDNITIDRKYLTPWTGRLGTRFVILTNELPNVADASGAMASRFVVLQLVESFYGREDPHLSDKLIEELPGILRWAVEGWKGLNARGHFIQPEASRGAVEALEELNSPIGAFIRDEIELGADYEADAQAAYARWQTWCERNGRDSGNAAAFGKMLHAAMPQIKRRRPGDRESRRYIYEGIRLG